MAYNTNKSSAKPTRQLAHINHDQQLHSIELKYLQQINNFAILNKDEDLRRLRVQAILLEDDNTTLEEQLVLSETTNAETAAEKESLVAELEEHLGTIQAQENQIRRHEREYAQLTTELQSMSSVTKDSANILAEKLALSREVAVLRPEIEHLRSQISHQQSTLAEKLSLERQVNTLEVELANEKKATKRILEKRDSIDRVEDELRTKLRDVEKRLAAEKAERQRIEDQLENERRDHQYARDSQDTSRESESDLRKKLHDTQRQLRLAKEDYERVKDEMEAQQNASKKATKKAAAGSAAEEELRAELEAAQAKLEAAIKDKRAYREECDKNVAEAESRAEGHERKFEKLKTKFRELQEQVKQVKGDLQASQKAHASLEEEVKQLRGSSKTQTVRTKKGHEAGGPDFSHITIQTPGGSNESTGIRRGRKPLLQTTRPGEKSDFTITPFLNRSKDMDDSNENVNTSAAPSVGEVAAAPEAQASSPPPEDIPVDTAGHDEERQEAEEPAEAEEEQSKPAPKPRGRPKKVVADTAAESNDSQPAPKPRPKKRKSLEQTRAEATPFDPDSMPVAKKPKVKLGAKNSKLSAADSGKDADDSAPTAAVVAAAFPPEQKKRIRKFGAAKTIFDDDDDGELPAAAVDLPGVTGGGGGVRVPMSTSKRAGKTQLSGVQNAFAAGKSFSPLKRHRRGVGASFLA